MAKVMNEKKVVTAKKENTGFTANPKRAEVLETLGEAFVEMFDTTVLQVKQGSKKELNEKTGRMHTVKTGCTGLLMEIDGEWVNVEITFKKPEFELEDCIVEATFEK